MLTASASAILGESSFCMRTMLGMAPTECKPPDERRQPSLPAVAPPGRPGLRPADRGGDRDGGGPAVPARHRRPADRDRRARRGPALVPVAARRGGGRLLRRLVAPRRTDPGHAAVAHPREP